MSIWTQRPVRGRYRTHTITEPYMRILRARARAALNKQLDEIAKEAARLQALPWGIKTPVFVNVDTRLP